MTPQNQFKQDKEAMESFNMVINQPFMRKALIYAMQEFTDGPISTAELDGAKGFVNTFVQLTSDAGIKPLPKRVLTSDLGGLTAPIKKEEKK